LSPESLPGSQTLPLKSSLKKVAAASGNAAAGRHVESGGAVGSMEELRV
jgi:hypothetical protein